MGLDITAYGQMQRLESHMFDASSCHEAGHVYVKGNPDFPDQEEGLSKRCYMSALAPFRFCAGSYSGYNEWRDHLSKMAHGIPAKTFWDNPVGAFARLINFSDCEGAIGPKTSEALLAEFQGHALQAARYARTLADVDGEYWFGKYRQWTKAFELARDGGFVIFH